MPVINPVYTTQPGQPQPSGLSSSNHHNHNTMQPPPIIPPVMQSNSLPPQQQQYPGNTGMYQSQYNPGIGAPLAGVRNYVPPQQNQAPPPAVSSLTNSFPPPMNSTPAVLPTTTGGITSSSNRYPNPNPMLPPQPPPSQQHQSQQQPMQNQYAQQLHQQPHQPSAYLTQQTPQRPGGDGYVISGQPINPSNLYPNIPTALTNNNYPQQPQPHVPNQQIQPPMGGGGLPVNSHQQQNSYPNHPQQNNQHAYNNGGVAQLSSQMNNMTVSQGFNKMWGIEHADLLKTRQVLPPEGVKSPDIRFQHEYMNHVNCSPE